jgi:hypothetical protein
VSEHKPDRSKIAKPLAVLTWQPMDASQEWFDGTDLLVAVPVCGNQHSRALNVQKWSYEYYVVRVHCDEGYFNVAMTDNGDWGWELEDCDWYVLIRE